MPTLSPFRAGCLLLFAAMAIATVAQSFTPLATFTGTNGIAPLSVVQGFDGNFYGTTIGGGVHSSGTVFKITPAGTLATLYSFCALPNCTDGSLPESGLVQAIDGNLYGTTSYGGSNNGGTLFRITPAGQITILYSFCSRTYCTDGLHPYAALIQATDGYFYGSTEFGGASDYGTLFKISPQGAFTTLYSFCTSINCPDGAVPDGQLVRTANGTIYGTTLSGGGSAFSGTIFRISTAGKLSTLYSFCTQSNCVDGNGPLGQLVLAADGVLYGITMGGGTASVGTVFKFTPGGRLTTLHSFCSEQNCTDGGEPLWGLVQATDGNFYGTTTIGGAHIGSLGAGTIFRITAGGALTTLYDFCVQTYCPDGANPLGLFQATDGNFYGAAENGGSSEDGTLFLFAVGLRPSVKLFPNSGKVGTKVTILGTSLVGTSAVSFNGTPSTFTVRSESRLTATVPSGATTGVVLVTTPHGTLSSDTSFRVMP